MNFLKSIKILYSSELKALQNGNYSIIKIGKKPYFRFYSINSQEFLGRGAGGDVYKAYHINPKNGEIDRNHPCVAKVFHHPNDFDPEEVKILASYYKTDGCQRTADKAYIFS